MGTALLRVGIVVGLLALLAALSAPAARTAHAPRSADRVLLPLACARASGLASPQTATPVPSATATLPHGSSPTEPSATPWPTIDPTASPVGSGTHAPTPSPTPTGHPAPVITLLQCRGRHEIVRILNAGTGSLALEGWRLQSIVGQQELALPRRTLEPGTTLGVHSGPGAPESDGNNVRWTRAYRWNNAGDEALLLSPDGVERARRSCDDVEDAGPP